MEQAAEEVIGWKKWIFCISAGFIRCFLNAAQPVLSARFYVTAVSQAAPITGSHNGFLTQNM